MSHDLEIVVSIRPQHFLLEEFIALHNSLSISGQLGSETGNVIVYRRGGKTELVASFEVWGPSKVEPEDLEESVVSLVAAPRWMVEISVPAGGEGDDVPDAEALARYIAQRCKGVIYDPQAGAVVWPKPIAKSRPIPRQKEKIRLINLDWYLPRSQASLSTARNFLLILRELCPEAVPRRFGSYEPLQGRMEPDEEDPFLNAFLEECLREVGGGLFFSSGPPCFGGHIFTPHKKITETSPFLDVVHVSLNCDGRVLDAIPDWCDKIVRLFAELAERLKAFYAHGYVERGVYASRRGIGYGGDSEHYPLPRGRWVGIPSTPVWLAWFGGPYKPLVEASLKSSEYVSKPEGIFVRMGPSPLDLDELQGRTIRIPQELVARMQRKVKEVGMKRTLRSRIWLTTTLRRPRRIKYVDWEATPAKFVPALD